jgi:hypothetical protein
MFKNLLIAMDLSHASVCLLRCVGPLRTAGAESATLVHVMNVRSVGGLYISLKHLPVRTENPSRRKSSWGAWPTPPANCGETGSADPDHGPRGGTLGKEMRCAVQGPLPPPAVRHRFLRTRRAGGPLPGAHCGAHSPSGSNPLPRAGPGEDSAPPRAPDRRIQPYRPGTAGCARSAAQGVGGRVRCTRRWSSADRAP